MERVTRAEAARMLNVNRSTITRWTERHPALLDSAGLVDPVELQRHRDAMVNPKLQTRGAAARGEPAPLTDGRAGFGGNRLNYHRVRGEAAKAISAELDLAARLKLTIAVEDAERQIFVAAEAMKRKAAELARDQAEPLARIADPRAMERAIGDLMREIRETWFTTLMHGLDTAPA